MTTPDQPPLWQSLQPVLPLVLFLGVNRVAGLRWAVVAATAWSIKVVIDRRRQNLPLGRIVPLITAAVILRGLAGVITNSEVVYFGLGIATKYVASAVLLGSAIVMRPLGNLALRRGLGLSAQLVAKPAIAAAARWATVVAGLYYLFSATFDVWLLERSSIDGFVIVRFVVNWPLGIAALGSIYWLFSRGFDAVPEAPDLVDALDARLEELGASR